MTKEQLKTNFEDTMTSISDSLFVCKVSQKQITQFTHSPTKYNEFKQLMSWTEKVLQPGVSHFTALFNLKEPFFWISLRSLDPYHPDIKQLENIKKEVRKIWLGRPKIV